MSTMRRRAKTPVFSIGQLEACQDNYTPYKASSVELIAEQYRALLEFRDTDSIYTDSHSEPPPSRQGFREEDADLRRQLSSDNLRPGVVPLTVGGPAYSPTSDDGTLVSFDEERVYFKPISFSPEPSSPIPTFAPAVQNPAAAASNLSLQICLDLLTRELSSAITERRNKTSNETAALQIWVMIEAYERLRDQVAELRIARGERSGVETMFETWLSALYAIHDSLTFDSVAVVSDSEYEGLEEALD